MGIHPKQVTVPGGFDGTQLTNLTLDLSIPGANSYLATLIGYQSWAPADVDIWIEGLQKDPNFVFSLIQRDASNNIVSRDDTHMTIAEWKFVSGDGRINDGVANIGKQTLLDAADGLNDAEVQDSETFRVVIDGASPSMFGDVTITSDENPLDSVVDTLTATVDGSESAHSAILYYSDDSDDLLSASERQLIADYLNLDAVHNQSSTVKTGGPNAQARTNSLNAKQILIKRLGDEARVHRKYVYFNGVPGNPLANLQAMFSADAAAASAMTNVGFGPSGNTQAETFSANKMRIKSTLPQLTAVHELVHVRQFAGNWNAGDALHDEAEAWVLERMLTTAKFLESVEDGIAAGDAVKVKLNWASAWNRVNGFPSIIGSFAPKPGTNGTVGRPITASDVWDVNNPARLGVRFSASNLGMIYNQMIVAKGIVDPATGAILILVAPAPTTPPGPFD